MRRYFRDPIAWGAIALVVVTALVTASFTAVQGGATADPVHPLRIGVVGGYETVGTQNLVVWPTLMAERKGWAVSNGALPDAGYVADGRGGYAFTYQVDRAIASDPDIILLVGGASDAGFEDDRIVHGASELFAKLVRDGTRTLVVGPTWYETPVPDRVATASELIRSAAGAAGLPYLDALNPPWLTPDLMRTDRTGPTDEGQAVLADRIAEWVHEEVEG